MEELDVEAFDDASPVQEEANASSSVEHRRHIPNGDAFTQQFSNTVEDLMQSFKAQAMQSFLMAERSMETTHRAEMKAQQTNLNQIVSDKNLRIESLAGTQTLLAREVEKKILQVKRLIHLGYRMRESRHCRHLLAQTWLRWRLFRRVHAEDKLKNSFVRRHRDQRLARVIWQCWSRCARTGVVERRINRLTTQKDIERSSVIECANLERERLEFCVKELTEQLAQETQAKKNIQENVKTVFMRGVCALNFEAMSLMDDKPLAEIANEPLGQTYENVETTLPPQLSSPQAARDSEPIGDTRNTSSLAATAGPGITTSPRPFSSPVTLASDHLFAHSQTVSRSFEHPRKLEPHPLPFVTYTTQPKPARTKHSKWVDAPVKRVC
eukprot:GEMP01049534.1.p1 GENE.GEMP01049534.1~~GEMP01049534.1.p1  ORF type:complete len:382 (+),score=73.28 GEMP01049534.1:34-1179(+)